MGTSTSGAQFAAKMSAAGRAVHGARRKGVFEAGLVTKDLVEASAGASGLRAGSSVLAGRRWGGIGFDVKGSANPAALVKAKGPAWLHNNPTRPHRIVPRRRGRVEAFAALQQVGLGGARRRPGRRGASALTINGSVRASARHPGTSGHGWWQRAVDGPVPPAALQAYRLAVRRALSKVLG